MKGGSDVDWKTAVPLITSIISGIFLLINSRTIFDWTARQMRRTQQINEGGTVQVAKIEDAADERKQMSAERQWLVLRLQDEIQKLTERVDAMGVQLQSMYNELDTVRRDKNALWIENDNLKRRVNTLDVIATVLRQELQKHGIPIPAVADFDQGKGS